MSDNNNSNTQYKISRKRLTADEVRQYKLMGIPDQSQDWLELFTTEIVNDLFEIIRNNSNNPKKAKMISKYMSYYGFEDVGLGTNVFVMHNPRYPGVVYKFALDDFGLADNYNDMILQDAIPRYTKMLDRHPSSIVTVQERKVVVSSQERMDVYRASIIKTLEKLSSKYLIVDLSPNNFLNYGIDRNGDWCFIDASDLYPLKNIHDTIRCTKAVGWDEKHKKVKYCGGRFIYNGDFSRCICTKCNREVLPLELRPDDKEEKSHMANSYMDGFSFEARKQMIESEMQSVIAKRNSDSICNSTEVKEAKPECQLPTKIDPKTIFISDNKPPKKIDIKPEIIDEEEDDDDEGMESVAVEPKPINIMDILNGDSDETDDDEEDDNHLIFAHESDEADEKEVLPEGDAPNDISISFDITEDGIQINIDGSLMNSIDDGRFKDAWVEQGLPMFVRINNNFTQRCIGSDAMYRIVSDTLSDMLDE